MQDEVLNTIHLLLYMIQEVLAIFLSILTRFQLPDRKVSAVTLTCVQIYV